MPTTCYKVVSTNIGLRTESDNILRESIFPSVNRAAMDRQLLVQALICEIQLVVHMELLVMLVEALYHPRIPEVRL